MRRVQWSEWYYKNWQNLSYCFLPNLCTGVEEGDIWMAMWMLQYRGDVSGICQASCGGVLLILHKDYMKNVTPIFLKEQVERAWIAHGFKLLNGRAKSLMTRPMSLPCICEHCPLIPCVAAGMWNITVIEHPRCHPKWNILHWAEVVLVREA